MKSDRPDSDMKTTCQNLIELLHRQIRDGKNWQLIKQLINCLIYYKIIIVTGLVDLILDMPGSAEYCRVYVDGGASKRGLYEK